MTQNTPRPRYFFTYLFSGFLILLTATFLLRLGFMLVSQRPLDNLSTGDALYALFWGLRFDLASAAIVTSLIALPAYLLVRLLRVRQLPLWPFALGVVAFAITQISDAIYFLEAGRHSGYEIWSFIEEFTGLAGTAVLGYPWLVLAGVVLTALVLVAARGRRMTLRGGFPSVELSMLLWVAMAALCMRGHLEGRPMRPMLVFNIGNDNMAAIAENPNYTIIYTLSEGKTIKPVYQGFPTLEEGPYRQLVASNLVRQQHSAQAPQKPYNVILFALEAWPSYYMNDKSKGQPITPQFDALAKRGFTTDGLIAEGHRTAEGLFAMLCSYPNPLGDAIIKNKLMTNHYDCLPKILSQAGWETALFQGMNTGTVGSMGQKLGLVDSYGKHQIDQIQYPLSSWGVDDHDLFNFMLKKVKASHKPFFYVVNTTSTHDDNLPDGIPYIFGSDTAENRIKSALHYSDQALGQFVRELKKVVKTPTLLVITADHTRGPLPDRLTNYHTPFTMVILNAPTPKKHLHALASQRDVAPTILDWLGGKAPWFTGQSLWPLSAGDMRASYYTGGMFAWFTGTRMIEFPLARPGQLHCFDWNSVRQQADGNACTQADSHQQNLARAYIEYSQSLLFQGRTADYGKPSSLQGSKVAVQ
ncbi:MAG: LTA synthase family protein [Alcanivorax sp.]|nr:LTA synthase family protein [Alcanivorax sp.]